MSRAQLKHSVLSYKYFTKIELTLRLLRGLQLEKFEARNPKSETIPKFKFPNVLNLV